MTCSRGEDGCTRVFKNTQLVPKLLKWKKWKLVGMDPFQAPCIYINDLCEDVEKGNVDFYVDDTILYTSSASFETVINTTAFNVVQ